MFFYPLEFFKKSIEVTAEVYKNNIKLGTEIVKVSLDVTANSLKAFTPTTEKPVSKQAPVPPVQPTETKKAEVPQPIEQPKPIVEPTQSQFVEVIENPQPVVETQIDQTNQVELSQPIEITTISENYLDYFKFDNDLNINQVLYKKIDNLTQLDDLLQNYSSMLETTSQEIDSLKQKHQLPEDINIYKVFDSFARLLGRAMKQVDQRKVKLTKELDSAYDSEEFQEILYVFFKQNIESNLITPIIGAIYHGMKYDNDYRHVYVECIGFLNQLFKQLGMQIVPAENNTPFDFDMYEALPIYDEHNQTNDINLKECFYEIQQFAYMFDDAEHYIALGQAVVWRYDPEFNAN